jgi:DNA-binding XRE family transcriptional regulator
LRTLREDRIGSQTALALEVGASWRSVARWEAGSTQPSPTTLVKLAEVLGAPLDDFAPRVPIEAAA